MGRKPNYDLTLQPQWVQNLIADLQAEKDELYAQLEESEGIINTLAKKPIDDQATIVYLKAHDEATCPTADCPDRINGSHGL